MTEAVQIAVE